MFKPVELEIELFCRGMRVDPRALSEDAGRPINRTRAGLGSGLEVILPGRRKDIWVNVPVIEPFAAASPLLFTRVDDALSIVDERDGAIYPVQLPREPEWYGLFTSYEIPMRRIGILQGNYLGIYVSNRCSYWAGNRSMACKFCTTGDNVGAAE